MNGALRRRFVFFGFFAVFAISQGNSVPAHAVTVELAKQCRALAVAAHPTARTGTRTQSQTAQRDYYKDCIAKNGQMNDKSK